MSSIIAENTVVASSYKNNSLPLEEGGDRKLVLLTHDSHGYHIRILEFSDQEEWEVRLSLHLSSENCVAYPPISTDYVFNVAYVDDLGGTTQRFFVFVGFGKFEGLSGIWYFVFDLHDSEYRYLNCGEFDDILDENGLDTQYFRSLTAAPKGQDGICRLVVGYQQKFVENQEIRSKSGIKVGYLTYDDDSLSYVEDYVPPELITQIDSADYYPKPIGYMGVMARDNAHDVVILLPGYVFPQDDVLFVHQLGDAENIVRRSWGTECQPLLDHPTYFCRILFSDGNGVQKNIGIVRGDVGECNGSSFVRYAVELDPDVLDSFVNYKVVLDASPLEPNIRCECALFHMDSGAVTNDGNDDLVVIWKECEDCSYDYYVLKITGIAPASDPEDCEDIASLHSFVTQFNKDDITDLAEPVYIRYTTKEGGYFLSLFYHDTSDGISVHVEEYDF